MAEGTLSARVRGRPADVFVGRGDEVARLQRTVDTAAAGSVRVVLIEGEPGIGKTRLLGELVRIAAGRGFAVRSGRAEELERDRAFGMLAPALRMAHMSVPNVADSTAPTSPLRFEFVDRIVETVLESVLDQPLLLAFDDLQWADPASLEAIGLLSRRLPEARLLVAGACRPIPRSTELAQLADSLRDVVERIRLLPLDPGSVLELAESLAGHPIGVNLARQTASAGGNPFFIRELIGALDDDGLITLVDGHADVSAPSVPPSLRVTIMRRLGFLPEPTVELLRWATILGSSFAVADLAVACSKNTPEVIRGLDPSLRAGVLVDADPRLAFRHDLVREAIYGDIPRGVRAGMHLEVAQRRLAAGALPLDVAPHFARGVVGRDPQAAEWVRLAAAEVAPQSPASAVELLERGLEMTAPVDEVRRQIMLDLVRAKLWSGRWSDAEQLARQILELEGDSPRAASLRYAMARSYAYRGRMADSIAEAEAAIDSPATSARERARLLADLSLRRPLVGDLDGGEAAAREALDTAQADDTLARRTALSGLALTAALRGDTTGAVDIARSAVPLSVESTAEAVEIVQPSFFLTIALTEADQFAEALALMRQLRQRVETRMSWVSALVGVLIGQLLFLTGEWADAIAETETSLELSKETGTRVWSVRALAVLAATSARQGDRASAQRYLAEGDALVDEVGPGHVGFDHWLLARATVADAAGDGDTALARLTAGWDECAQRGWVVSRRTIGPDLVRRAIDKSRHELARSVAAAVAEAARIKGAPRSMIAAADHCAGLVGRDEAALRRAVQVYQEVGLLATLGGAEEDLGTVLQGAGSPERARAAYEEAASTYFGLGAEVDRLRVEQRLRSLGVRRGAAGRRGRPETGWQSLTATELQVGRLAAEGMTNREIGERLFISHRTVATHLAHIFGKVGISSRIELARALARGDIGDKSVM